jgi:hypothetical protein
MNRQRSALSAVCSVGLVLSGLALTGCDGADRAWDCAKTAAHIAGDIQDLQDKATNLGQVSDASRRQETVNALDKVRADLTGLGDHPHDADVAKAADNLDTAVDDARMSVVHGRTPDLKPVGTAAADLTRVCAPGT